MIQQMYHEAQPQEGKRTPKNTPTDTHLQEEPERLARCIGGALLILRGDQTLRVKVVKRQK